MEKDVKLEEKEIEMVSEKTEQIETIEKEEVTEIVSEETEKIETTKKEEAKETSEIVEEKTEKHSSSEFEKMLEDSLLNFKNIEVGDQVKGEVINITDSYIFVTLGGKHDAFAEKQDYINKNGKLSCKIGDMLQGYVVKKNETEIIIAKSLITVNLNLLHEAYEEKIPVKGKVQSITKGGYLISISGVRAFCPISHIDLKIVTEPKQFINKTFDFVIIDFKDKGKNIVVSRKVILKEAQTQKAKEFLKNIEIGSIVKGKVIRLTNFGAFIDLGGIEGLLHISQFSWEHIESPSEIVNLGDEIETKVIKIKRGKISLSMKALQENPLDKALKELKSGDTVKCKVLRNLPFGSFVQIKNGVEALIPISEMAYGRKIATPSEVLKEGDFVEAQILKINEEERQISLSLKRMHPNPWDTISEEIAVDDVVTGKIENVVKFGAFIHIIDGVTGLLPASKLKLAQLDLNKNNVGEEIKVRVTKIDTTARRISLEPTDMPETPKVEEKSKKVKTQKSESEIIQEDNPFSHL